MSYIDRINVQGTEYDVLDRRVRLADGQDFDYGTLVQGGINNNNGYTTGAHLRRSETYWPVIEGPANVIMQNGLTGYIRLYDADKTMIDPGEEMPGSDTTNHVLVIAKNTTMTLAMKDYNPNTAYFRFYFSCGSEEYVSALVRENARIVPLQTVATSGEVQAIYTQLSNDASDLKSAFNEVTEGGKNLVYSQTWNDGSATIEFVGDDVIITSAKESATYTTVSTDIDVTGINSLTVSYASKSSTSTVSGAASIRYGFIDGTTNSWKGYLTSSPMTIDVSATDKVRIGLYVNTSSPVVQGTTATFNKLQIEYGDHATSYTNSALTAIDQSARAEIEDVRSLESKFIRHDISQSLTANQQAQARTNIGAASDVEVSDLKSEIPYQIENPYAVADEVDGYFNPDGTIHVQTAKIEKACLTYFPVKQNVPYKFILYVKVPDGESIWNRVVRYNADKEVIGNGTTTPTYIGQTDDGYSIYKYGSDGKSLDSTIAYHRYSYRSFGDAYVQYIYGDYDFPYTLNTKDIKQYFKNVREAIVAVGKAIYKFDSINLRSIAHRGWVADGEPENTMWSFKAAVNHNFPFIETDLAFTSDGVPVLIHDPTINRTARNADGTEITETISINDITYAQALTYDFGIWSGNQYAGTKIPTLEEFIVFCRNTGTFPYIELKSNVGNSQANINAVIAMIKKYHMLDCVTFISFNIADFLEYVKNADESVRLGALLNNTLENSATNISNLNALKTSKNRIFWDYSYSYFSLDETNIVNSAIENGVEIETWTLSNTQKVREMNDYVTGVTSDGINFAEIKKTAALQ